MINLGNQREGIKMTTFHAIHILVGAWLVLAPFTGLLDTATAVFWNNVIIGAVVALYNIYFLFLRQNIDTETGNS